MQLEYLLKQLILKGRALRKAQKAYYKAPGSPREDPIKKAHLEESRRREQDFDMLLVQVQKIHPVAEEE